MRSRSFRKTIPLCCLLAIFLVCSLAGSSPVVNANPCNIVQLNAGYPSTVNPGETIQVTTNMSIACAQWRTYYTGRTDLMDIQSKNLLSASPFDIGFLPFVNVSVANAATVPQVSGPWTVGLIIYIFEDGDLLGSMSRSFTIQVGTTNVSSTQATSTAQTSAVGSTTSSAISVFSTSQSQPSIAAPSAASPMVIEPTYAVFGALVVGLCVVVAALVLEARKRNA